MDSLPDVVESFGAWGCNQCQNQRRLVEILVGDLRGQMWSKRPSECKINKILINREEYMRGSISCSGSSIEAHNREGSLVERDASTLNSKIALHPKDYSILRRHNCSSVVSSALLKSSVGEFLFSDAEKMTGRISTKKRNLMTC
jgi:hypothetical protein